MLDNVLQADATVAIISSVDTVIGVVARGGIAMEYQRFTSLSGRARQWLPPEEFEPEQQAPPPSSRLRPHASVLHASEGRPSLASVADLLHYKRSRASTR